MSPLAPGLLGAVRRVRDVSVTDKAVLVPSPSCFLSKGSMLLLLGAGAKE